MNLCFSLFSTGNTDYDRYSIKLPQVNTGVLAVFFIRVLLIFLVYMIFKRKKHPYIQPSRLTQSANSQPMQNRNFQPTQHWPSQPTQSTSLQQRGNVFPRRCLNRYNDKNNLTDETELQFSGSIADVRSPHEQHGNVNEENETTSRVNLDEARNEVSHESPNCISDMPSLSEPPDTEDIYDFPADTEERDKASTKAKTLIMPAASSINVTEGLSEHKVDGFENSFHGIEDQMKTDPKVGISADKGNANEVSLIDNDPIYDCFGATEDPNIQVKEENNKEFLMPDYEKLTKSEDKQHYSGLFPLPQSFTSDEDNYEVALHSKSTPKTNNVDKLSTQVGKETENRTNQPSILQEHDPFRKVDNEHFSNTAVEGLGDDKFDGSKHLFQDLNNQTKTDPKTALTSEDEESTSDKITPTDNDPIYDCFGYTEDPDIEAKAENSKTFLNLDDEKQTNN